MKLDDDEIQTQNKVKLIEQTLSKQKLLTLW